MPTSSSQLTTTSLELLHALLRSGNQGRYYLPGPDSGIEGVPSHGVYVLPDGRLTLHRGQTLIFGAGARLAADAGGTHLVVQGRIEAGVNQFIFEVGSEESTLTVQFLSGSVEQVVPQWWGAALGLGISDAVAIGQMLYSIQEDGVDTVVFPATATYVLNSTVTLLPAKRYLAHQAAFLAGTTHANPLFALSSVGEGRTELAGFHLHGRGLPIALLRVVPNADDLARVLTWTLDSPLAPELVNPSLVVVPPAPAPASRLPRSPRPIRLAPLSANTQTTAAGTRTLIIRRCEFRDASEGLVMQGTLEAELSDCAFTTCDVGLDLDVVGGPWNVRRLTVHSANAHDGTEVRLRVHKGTLGLDSVTVRGRLTAEVGAGELRLDACRLGFTSIAPTSTSWLAEISDGRVVFEGCVFDDARDIGTALATLHLRRPHRVTISNSTIHLHERADAATPATAGLARVGLWVDWDHQLVGSVVLDGCLWTRVESNRKDVHSVAIHVVDLPSAPSTAFSKETELHNNVLVARRCSFSAPCDVALSTQGASVELDGCVVESPLALWVQSTPLALQVVTVRSLTFQPPPTRSSYGIFESGSESTGVVMVHQNLLLDTEVSDFQMPVPTPTGFTTVGQRLVEGGPPTENPNGVLSGFEGDLFRSAPAQARSFSDWVCVQTGEPLEVRWQRYRCQQKESP